MDLKVQWEDTRSARLRLSSDVAAWHLLFVTYNKNPKLANVLARNGEAHASIIVAHCLDTAAGEAIELIRDALIGAIAANPGRGWCCRVVSLQPYGRAVAPGEVLTLDGRFSSLRSLGRLVYPIRDNFVQALPVEVTGRKPTRNVISITALKRRKRKSA